jgi:hypothetical protein
MKLLLALSLWGVAHANHDDWVEEMVGPNGDIPASLYGCGPKTGGNEERYATRIRHEGTDSLDDIPPPPAPSLPQDRERLGLPVSCPASHITHVIACSPSRARPRTTTRT